MRGMVIEKGSIFTAGPGAGFAFTGSCGVDPEDIEVMPPCGLPREMEPKKTAEHARTMVIIRKADPAVYMIGRFKPRNNGEFCPGPGGA